MKLSLAIIMLMLLSVAMLVGRISHPSVSPALAMYWAFLIVVDLAVAAWQVRVVILHRGN